MQTIHPEDSHMTHNSHHSDVTAEPSHDTGSTVRHLWLALLLPGLLLMAWPTPPAHGNDRNRHHQNFAGIRGAGSPDNVSHYYYDNLKSQGF
jgi:hypothetical protein